MSELTFQSPQMAWLFFVILLLVGCFIYRAQKQREDVNKFSGGKFSGRKAFGKIRILLICIAACLITAALMEPVWRKVSKNLHKEGRDLVFILDVSRSMHAEDLIPNRLERAKINITECVNSLNGSRVGLVVFAGSSTIKCPLTLDYDFFIHILNRVDIDSVDTGGTRIEDAVLKTCDKLFTDSKNGNKDIILISDGGDLGSGVEKAVEEINRVEAKIITIGIGDEINGARIPLENGKGYVKYKGKEVWTKLEHEQLRLFSKECRGGAYLPAGTKQMDLARIYSQFLQNENESSVSEHSIMVYKDEYTLFLGLALGLLVIVTVLPASIKSTAVKTIVIAVFFMSPQLKAQSLESADKLFYKGKYEEAAKQYVEIAHKYEAEQRHIYFNIANSYYKMERFKSAAGEYRNTLMKTKSDKDFHAVVSYNLANSLFKMADTSDKNEEKLQSLKEAVKIYRRVIMQKPTLKKAAVNFELAKIKLLEVKKELDRERQKMQEMQKELDAVRKGLEQIIKDEEKLLKTSVDKVKGNQDLAPLEPEQTKITGATKLVNIALRALSIKDKVLQELNLYDASLSALAKAITAEQQAIAKLSNNDKEAVNLEKTVLEQLKEALNQLPEKPQQPPSDNSSESESDGEGEEGEEGMDEEEPPESDPQDMSADSEGMENKKEQVTDLPNDSIEEILKLEDKLHEIRKAAGKKGRAQKVEKDW